MGLRGKLVIGFGGMLAILAVVSVLFTAVLHRYTTATERIIDQDLKSVSAANRMRDSIEKLDDTLQRTANEGRSDTSAAIIEEQIATFDAALAEQKLNITLSDEREATEKLVHLWERYKTAYNDFVNGGEPERKTIYAARLQPLVESIRGATLAIFDANTRDIPLAHGAAKEVASRAQDAMIGLALCGAAAAMLFALLIGRGIVRPVQSLTQSVRQIEQGNLDLPVVAESRDELGALARAFNSMACQLKELRRAERERLVRTERTTQLAIDSLPDAVMVVNPRCEVELANQTAERLLGVEPGKPIDAAPGGPTGLGARLGDLHRRAMVEGALNPGATGYESAIQAGDPEHAGRYYLPKAVPILDERNHVIGTTIVLTDVTDLRRLDEMKSNLLAMVSHELKTPLTSVRMILPLLLDEKVGPLTEKQRDLLDVARRDANRLHEIVESLLDMDRIESGAALMSLKPVSAAELVFAAAEPLMTEFQARGLRLGVDLPARAPLVLADTVRIGHVLVNLLDNALKYTPRGGSVRVGINDGEGYTEFIVSNSGATIPPQHLPRLFEKFFRVPGQDNGEGAGLGLAIVKDIVEAHGGRIAVESPDASGRGTTFRFTLPHATAPRILDESETPGTPRINTPFGQGRFGSTKQIA